MANLFAMLANFTSRFIFEMIFSSIFNMWVAVGDYVEGKDFLQTFLPPRCMEQQDPKTGGGMSPKGEGEGGRGKPS